MRIGQRAAVTDTGRKRRKNEDAYVLRPPLFAVADGMGGAQAGEIASRLAAEAIAGEAGAAGAEERVEALVQAANRRVYERSNSDATASGMGTTVTVALVHDGLVTIGHVGDSRAYLLREGSLQQLTDDHSLVAELMRGGKLSAEEAESHPQRSVITRVLGTEPDVDVDVFTLETRPGDVFLLCSDGLTSMVGDDVILKTVEQNRRDLQSAARSLIAHANRGGGEDNITVVCFDIAEGSPDAAADETAPLPAAAAEPDPDEDTLDELDRVPAVGTMIVTPEQARALAEGRMPEPEPEPGPPPEEPRPAGDGEGGEGRKGVLLLVAALAVVLLVVAALLLYWGLA